MIDLAFLEHDFEVRFRDVGNSNVLTNMGLLGFLEDIGGIHSNLVGLGMNDIEKTRSSWVLLGWKVKIFDRPLYGSKVKVKTWASHTEKFHTYRDFEVFDEAGNRIAIATSKWVLVNIDTGKIARIEDKWINLYEPEDVHVFTPMELPRLKESASFLSSFSYTVKRADIDINNHMHNLFYLDLAYEALPEEIYRNIDFKNIDILYKKQIRYGDTINCLYSMEDNIHTICIKSQDLKELHAIIQLR